MESAGIDNNVIHVTSNDYTWYNFSTLKIKKLDDKAIMPQQSNDTDAGYDLFSIESKTIQPGQRAMIHTGIAMAIPNNYVGLIWPRSGLALKNGIDVLAGVVDSGYRGEACVVLQNHGTLPYEIHAGFRIAQILFQKVEYFRFQEVEELNEADRGDSGFGSSGV